jgi:two-component system response regulator AtoC
LKVFPVWLSPLRERPEDVLLLARHFVQRFSREMRRPLIEMDPGVEARLLGYRWPGNVRELRNVLERAVILASGDVLTVEHLPPELEESAAGRADGTPRSAPVSLPAEGLRLEEVERDLVRQALESTGGNQVRAARLLGISRDALRNRMKKFGLLAS